MKLIYVARNVTLLGGQSRILWELSREALGEDHEVHLVARRFPSSLSDTPLHSHRVFSLPPFVGEWCRFRLFATLASRRTDRLSRSGGVVHGFGDSLRQHVLSLGNVDWNYGKHIPGRTPDRTAVHIKRRALTDPGLRFLVLVSEAMRRDVLDLLPDFDTRKIRVIPPGVDPARFARVDRETGRDRLSREWGVPREGVRLVFAAGGDFEKRNVATLAQALLRLADRPDWHLVLVGAREGQVSWPGALRPRTSFLGRVADVGPVYAGCDLMVYPAWYDEFAMVVLEAMASGLPVILTRTVGAAEVLGERNRAQGVLSDPADAVALAARIARFLEDPGERRAMGEENRAAADRLRWTSIYRAYRALYDEVAAVDKA